MSTAGLLVARELRYGLVFASVNNVHHLVLYTNGKTDQRIIHTTESQFKDISLPSFDTWGIYLILRTQIFWLFLVRLLQRQGHSGHRLRAADYSNLHFHYCQHSSEYFLQ